jgi:erythromycin esterase
MPRRPLLPAARRAPRRAGHALAAALLGAALGLNATAQTPPPAAAPASATAAAPATVPGLDLTPATAAEEAAAAHWLRTAGQAFVPDALGPDELAPLVRRVAGARIVGIGEATHGGHQDQAFKAELIKALVRAGQTDVLLLEVNREAAAGFDRYVREGQGDPVALMRSGAFFRIWRNDAFAGLLLWLRQWNLQGGRGVRIVGVDMQDAGRDAAVALAWLRTQDAAAASRLAPPLGTLLPVAGREPPRFVEWYLQRPLAEVERARGGVDALAAWFDAAAPARRRAPGFDDARGAAQRATQAFRIFAFERPDADRRGVTPEYLSLRDRLMADNAVAALAEGERAVLWAHDGHVLDRVPALEASMGFAPLGTRLRERLGEGYRTVGFTWSRGSFHATRMSGYDDPAARSIGARLDVVTLPNDREGELGRVFDATGAQAMWIDLATRPREPLLDRWVQRRYWRGWAGWGVVESAWQKANVEAGDVPLPLDGGLDVIVWFRTLSPSRLWPAAPAVAAPTPAPAAAPAPAAPAARPAAKPSRPAKPARATRPPPRRPR